MRQVEERHEEALTTKRDGLSLAIVGASVALVMLTLAGMLVFGSAFGFRQTAELAHLPWVLPVAQAFVVLSAVSITFLCLGRYLAMGGAWVYRVGAVFLANAILGTFYLLAWPGLLGDRGLITQISNTASWFFYMTFAPLVLLVVIVSVRPAGRFQSSVRAYVLYGAVIAASVLVAMLSLVFENSLPVFIVGIVFTPLTVAIDYVLVALLAAAAILTYLWYRREGDSIVGYLALFLVLMTFFMLFFNIGGKRYDVWWYGARFISVIAYPVLLFGLLQEGYKLFGLERVRVAERERLLVREEQAHQQAVQALATIKALQSVTDATLSSLPLDEFLHELLSRVRQALSSDTATVLLLTKDGQHLEAWNSSGLEEEVKSHVSIPVGQGITGRIAASREPLVVEDISQVEVANPILLKAVRSLIGVPLLVDGRLIGVIHVGRMVPHRFTRDDLALLQLVADRSALAIDREETQVERQRLLEKVQSQYEELQSQSEEIQCQYEELAAMNEELVAANQSLIASSVEGERLLKKAEEAVRARDEFLSIASHELKTPLTSLLGYSQVLNRQMERAGVIDQERLRRVLETIGQQSTKLANLISQLLDVSRIEAGKLMLNCQTADLTSLVEAAIDDARQQGSQHEIVLRSPDKVGVCVDALRLEQVLANLIDNAMKYSSDTEPIEVEVTADGKTVRIAVIDHGVGVPPEHREHIFDRFYQAQRHYPLGGLGLGLFISKQIVEMHGGMIEAQFPDEGGTRMVATLPLV